MKQTTALSTSQLLIHNCHFDMTVKPLGRHKSVKRKEKGKKGVTV